jgi:nucleotide-binding universal stress UspA family protein
MFRTVVVALDLSPAEQPIIECLPDLQKWGVARIVLAHVIQIGYGQGAGYGHEADYQAWLEKSAEPLRAAGLEVSIALRASGVPADEILAVAEEYEADLLVIGSRSRNMVRALFLGSVAREVIRMTKRPLLLQWVEPTADATRVHCEAVCRDLLAQPLLATDFSRHASAAEAAAAAISGKAGHILCLSVLTPQALEDTPALPVMARAALEAIVARIAACGGEGECVIETGEPTATIVRVAGDRGCSLLIVGKHGQNWIEGTVIGSTAAQLCETARRPVLMVPLG